MTNAIEQLDKLDRRREVLALYEARLNRLFFAKSLRDRQLRRVQQAWLRVNNERQHLFSLIMANPQLREQLKDREKQRYAQSVAAMARKPEGGDCDAHCYALETVRSLDAERQAKNAYQDAVWFRKNGDWRSANIDAKDLDRLIDTLRQETAKTVLQRANAQHIFETAARKQFGDEPAHILERDTVLAEATEHFDTSESVAENAFTVWLAARGLTPPERRKKHKLKM